MTLAAHGVHLLRGGRTILNEVNIALAPGELVCLVGPNGAGKSSLIRCLDAIMKPMAGHITVDDQPIAQIRRDRLARLIAYVPQHHGDTLGLDVTEMITLGRSAHRHSESAAERRSIVEATIRQFGLGDFARRPFDALSGGERQRVLIARAVAQDTRYLLLDEPTGALDLRHQLDALSHVRRLVARAGVGVMMAIHDLAAAARFADRIALLHEGRLVAIGPWQDVLTREHLRTVFCIDAHIGLVDNLPYVLPLATMPVQP